MFRAREEPPPRKKICGARRKTVTEKKKKKKKKRIRERRSASIDDALAFIQRMEYNAMLKKRYSFLWRTKT